MTILTISDLHGRTVWKEADFSRYDRVVFLGDYTDSYDISDETIYANLLEIIKLKRKQPAKFVLLIGNHDAQYLHFPHYRCSGFRAWAQPDLSALFAKHDSLFQIAYQQGSYLFSHAGVTNRWLDRLTTQMGIDRNTITPDFDLAALLNTLHQQPLKQRNILFEVGPKRGGFDSCSGPVWADRDETRTDYLPGFHQVVGHTPTPAFKTIGDDNGSITYSDVLQTRTEFYEVSLE
ncbi:metallophosphoesterase [Spirosoma montaniterrae]|uniref:Metallophosphoesterase n=1 Tax=Spirosoma montaniterrae TaxID=1178516 RepID=A0A1P9WY59_9BACT|nr:metallophosphoesterase [Spirosoma montaniterrae]AQG80311.1 metallophosphoesterase [Spirosoma montaniterrae]